MRESDGGAAAMEAGAYRMLKIVVFVCGAVLMSLEMAGVRVLNVYFGSTIYVWGAIIGIFLGALSLGYYIGGMVADRHPRATVLGLIIFVAAAFVLLVPWLAGPVCRGLGRWEGGGPRLQALVSSVVLYFIPSVALGMVSPFAVKLAAHGMADLGRVAGRLYALSTLGSICGTFLTSFVLVEWLGTQVIIIALGITLIVAALLLVQGGRSRALAGVAALVLLVPAWQGAPASVVATEGWTVLEEFDSAYHHIVVTEGPSWYPGHDYRSRFLLFNRQAQSGIELEGPGRDAEVVTACGYTDMLHLGMLFRATPPQRLLVVGCGGGVGPLVFRQDYPALERIDVVDIDPYVFTMARQYFRFPAAGADEVLRAYVRDGRLFVTEQPDGAYDYIVLDAYSAGGRIPFHLITQEFFTEVRRVLAPDGVMVINVISAVEDSAPAGALYRAATVTLETVFPQVYVFPRSLRDERQGSNIIMVALPQAGERRRRRDLIATLTQMQSPAGHHGVAIRRERLREYVYNLVEPAKSFPEAPVLTDDYAPTDSMVSR